MTHFLCFPSTRCFTKKKDQISVGGFFSTNYWHRVWHKQCISGERTKTFWKPWPRAHHCSQKGLALKLIGATKGLSDESNESFKVLVCIYHYYYSAITSVTLVADHFQYGCFMNCRRDIPKNEKTLGASPWYESVFRHSRDRIARCRRMNMRACFYNLHFQYAY